MINTTIDTYNNNVDLYIERTINRTVTPFLDEIINIVGSGRVLEIGSGPGWDADYIENHSSIVVDRTDAAKQFVTLMHNNGHNARQVDVRTDVLGSDYDAVMALAVFPHLTTDEFTATLVRCKTAVRVNGLLAFTIKEGNGEYWSTTKFDTPRFWRLWQESELRQALAIAGWRVKKIEHHTGFTAKWLHVIATRAN